MPAHFTAHSQGASASLQLASVSWPTSVLLADVAHWSRGQVIQYAWCNTCWQLTDVVELAWLLASHLMLHFGPIQALGLHGRRLVITIKDDRSVITLYARTRAGKQCPTRRSPHRYVWHFDQFIAHQWPLFYAGILLILQYLEQPVFGNRILKGQKWIRILFSKFEFSKFVYHPYCVCRVTICATLVYRKWTFTFWPVTSKSRSNWGWICQFMHACLMHLCWNFGDHRSVTCRDNAHTSFLYDDLKNK